jgi:hypothetical protein
MNPVHSRSLLRRRAGVIAALALGTGFLAMAPTSVGAQATFDQAAPRIARTVSLQANKTKVKKGRNVTLSGVVTQAEAGTACTGSAGVEIQRKQSGESDFTTVTSFIAEPTGAFSTELLVLKTAEYRAVVPATELSTGSCDAATSPIVKVKAKRKKKR